MNSLKKKAQLKIKPFLITERYELVFWPDDCADTPSFDQLGETLALIEMYQEEPASFNEKETKLLESWLATNSIARFKEAYNKALNAQERLEEIEAGLILSNLLFPLNRRRHDN